MGMLKETLRNLFASPDGGAGKDMVLLYEKIVVAVALVVIVVVSAVQALKITNKAVFVALIICLGIAVYFIYKKETAPQKREDED